MTTTPSTAASAPADPSAPAAPSASRPARIAALDVLRGVALAGILLPNFLTVARFGYEADRQQQTTLADASGWIELLAHQRFFPIFSLLFGIGFALLLESAARRGHPHPRVVLLRRLLLLLPLGVLHTLVHPGEALAPYAVFGLLVLLPSSWLPRWAVATAGVAGVVLAQALFDGGLPMVPGLLLVGAALVRYGVVARMARPTLRGTLPWFALAAAAAAVAVPWHVRTIELSWSSPAAGIAGLLMAAAYVTGLLVLLSTRARGVLTAAFAPLGRTALTNYVLATPLMVLVGHLLDLPRTASYPALLLAAAGILVAQWAASTLWLRRFPQGPLEWLWRRGTWWGGVPS